MASLLDIKTRIKAVENIKKITRAMQLVAAAKFNRAQGRARSARPYSEELDTVLGALAAVTDDDGTGSGEPLELAFTDELTFSVDRSKFFAQNTVTRPGVVLVTSDRGLAGAFNTRLIRAALEFFRQHEDMDPKLITIGRKGHSFFKAKGRPVIYHEEGISDKLELGEIKRITGNLVRLFVEGEVDALYLIYAQFRSAMVNEVQVERFLSIPPIEDGGGKEEVYILEPDRESVYATLLPLYATTKIFATLADSFASEYGARMTAMQLATKNAEEMLDDLVILRNRLRQAIITKELSEIVGGAQALQ